MPKRIEPMLARTGELPSDDENWAFEIKWDGVRSIGYVDGGRLRLEARSGRDITPRYPELRGLGRALAGHDAIVDGEVVAFDDGRPSFQKLQGRMHLTSESHVRRLSESDPVNYILFDLLWLDGHSLTDLPYTERRERLLELGLQGDRWLTPNHHVGDGAAMLQASRAQGLEGVIAKRLDCPYYPGQERPRDRRGGRRLVARRGAPRDAVRGARGGRPPGWRARVRGPSRDGLRRARAQPPRRHAR
jgi:bifunctional non-homologous end joining protein LigD